MSTHPNDVQLIQRIQEGDTEAFEALFARYRQMITAHIACIVRDNAVAQDLVQEVFLRVWTRADQWGGRGKVRSWVYRIATNLSLNHLRSVKRRPQQSFDVLANDEGEDEGLTAPSWMVDTSALTPEALLEDAEQQRRLWHLINELPIEKREVFKMVYDDEMDLESVANMLGIPEGTVKSRLYHSRLQLRLNLTDNAG
jgi:RNA polymerase sigma-70 factor (ECF subfamily)